MSKRAKGGGGGLNREVPVCMCVREGREGESKREKGSLKSILHMTGDS